MKILRYIRYFGYISFNWNIPIAARILRTEISGEKKYGINTTGADELKDLDEMGIDTTHATIYMPVSYELLEEIFKQLQLLTSREWEVGNERNSSTNSAAPNSLLANIHFLDIGCGKGRAMCVAAHKGFRKITGIDFSKKLCEAAEHNCLITQRKIPAIEFKIINNDAFYYDISEDVDCIFMFNPFDEIIMSGVANNINESLRQHPRKMKIIYVNPLHKSLFTNAGFQEIYHSKKMKYLEVAILENKLVVASL